MKQILHTGHLGIERTKVNARGTMYWPNIITDIESMVANCTECQIYRNKLKKRLYGNTLSLKSHGQKWQLICFIVLITIIMTLFLQITSRNTSKSASFKTSPVKKSSQK